MKKLLIPLVLVVIGASVKAQSGIKEPPPPPKPKVVDEKVKFTPPKIVKNEEVKWKVDQTVQDDELKAFYNPSVSKFSMLPNNKIRMNLRNGKEEIYDLKKEDEKKALTDKYGEIPFPPPPPPKKVS